MSPSLLGVGLQVYGVVMACDTNHANCQREDDHSHLVRLLLPMPSVVPLPDGAVTRVEVLPCSGEPTVVMACLRRVSAVVDIGILAGLLPMYAAARELELIEGDGDLVAMGDVGDELSWTVADVITTLDSPESPDADWDGNPANLSPSQNFIARALAAVRPLVRATKLVGEWRTIEPTYERLPMLTLPFHAVVGAKDDWTSPAVRWEPAGILHLHHSNFLPGMWAPSEETLDRVERTHRFWLRSIFAQAPAMVGRELLLDAQRLHDQEGQYREALTLLWTGTEVLCDAVLSGLLWEEHWIDENRPDAARCAQVHFRDRNAVQRAKKVTARLLKGDWSSKRSPWTIACQTTYRLRNEVVHLGYQPARVEAEAGRKAADDFHGFLLDRLAANAHRFPRTAALIVGIDGMNRRGCGGGQFGRFLDQEAESESRWLEAWGVWHKKLVDSLIM